MGQHFSVREKSGNFVKTGKVREFYPKHWESMENDEINKLQKYENVYLLYGQKYFLASVHSAYLP